MAMSVDPDLSRRAFDRAREIAQANDYATVHGEGLSRDRALAVIGMSPAPGDPIVREARIEAYLSLGQEAEARKALEELVACCSHNGAWQIAFAYDYLGDRDRAFEWIDRARVQMDDGIRALRNARRFRDDPRTAEILRKMNLPAD
jgi:tetratricopeptide (TPR) repeat protein